MPTDMNLGATLGLEDAHTEMLFVLHARQLAAGRLSDAWETVDVLCSLRPFDPRAWKLMALTERRRGREEQAQMCEEAASWFE